MCIRDRTGRAGQRRRRGRKVRQGRRMGDRVPRTEMQPAARERLLEAMLSELGERGYGAMSVADALREAGVSRAGFEAEFADKDACLFAAYGQLTERLARRTTEGCPLGDEWPTRVRQGLKTLLE